MAPAAAGRHWAAAAFAAAAALSRPVAATAVAALRGGGQDLRARGLSGQATALELAPGVRLDGLEIPGLEEGPAPHAAATLGRVGVSFGLRGLAGPAAEAEEAAPALPRSDTAAANLVRRAPAYAEALPGLGPDSGGPPSTSYRQAMQNFGDVQYLSHITVGHQQLTGILDTGSFELVVFSKKCMTCGRAAKYDPEESKTYRKGILLSGQSYGSGNCYSRSARDDVSIGQFESYNQSFWEVTEARMPILFNAAFQSIIGLGPPETPQSDSWHSAGSTIHNVSMLLEEGRIPPSAMTSRASTLTTIAMKMRERRTIIDNFHSPAFSVCIGKEPGSDGFFVWNDNSHLLRPESFVRVQVVGKHTWSVRLTNARLAFKSSAFLRSQIAEAGSTARQMWWVRHKPLRQVKTSPKSFNASRNMIMMGCDDGCSALMDSGTSLLSVPTGIVDKLLIAVQKLHTNCSNIADLPHLEFELDGELFSLPPDAYILQASSSIPSYLTNFVRTRSLRSDGFGRSHCELAVLETYSTGQFGPLWILGVPFFRNFYTTFSVGETKEDRALFLAHAGPDCYPMDQQTAMRTPLQLYRRGVDLSKVWVPQTAARAADSDEVLL